MEDLVFFMINRNITDTGCFSLANYFLKGRYSIYIFISLYYIPMNTSVFLTSLSSPEPRNNLVLYGLAVKTS